MARTRRIQKPNRSGGEKDLTAAVRRFAGGASGSLVAAVIGQGLPLVVAAVLARILPPPAYGVFLFLYGTASTFAGLAGYSFGLTATQYVARLALREPQRAGAAIVQLLNATVRVSAGIAVLGAMLCARVEPESIRVAGGQWSIGVTALLFLALALTGVQSGILSGLHRFQDIARANLARMLIGLPLAILGALRFSLTGALAGLAIASVIGCAINHFQMVRACQEKGIPLERHSKLAHSEMWIQFSVPSFLASALVAPVLWIGQTVLLGIPNGLHEVAVFNIAQHWRNVIVFVPASMVQAATPLLAELLGSEDDRASTRIFQLNLAASGFVALCCGLAVGLSGKAILSAYGPAYIASWPVLVITAAAAVLAAMNNALGALIVAAGRMWAGFTLNFLWATAVLVQAIPLSHRWGALGLSVAVLSAYALHSAWQSVYILRARLIPALTPAAPVLADAH
jgi:O-antigen/teichoic acid export membrane protein